jgi:hypothetical protein
MSRQKKNEFQARPTSEYLLAPTQAGSTKTFQLDFKKKPFSVQIRKHSLCCQCCVVLQAKGEVSLLKAIALPCHAARSVHLTRITISMLAPMLPDGDQQPTQGLDSAGLGIFAVHCKGYRYNIETRPFHGCNKSMQGCLHSSDRSYARTLFLKGIAIMHSRSQTVHAVLLLL